MTENPDHTLEMLRRMRADYASGLAEVKAALKDLTAETRVTKAHVVALVSHEQYTTEKLMDLDSRLARVEKSYQLVGDLKMGAIAVAI
jgi:hypothetical protein